MDQTLAIEAVGSELTAACTALSKGQIARRAVAGAVGGLAGMAVSKMLQKNKSEDAAPGGHVGSIYVALGTDRIAFFEQKNGLVGASLGRLLATHDLDDITACEWKPARFGPSSLTITAGDATYDLEVALVQKGKAEKIVEALQSRRSRAA